MKPAAVRKSVRNLGPVGAGLIVVIVAVVAALTIVAVVIGVRLSGGLTYGDLLVGLGTFALAVLTAVLADATFGVDKRAAEREQHQEERELRGLARLIDGELAIVQQSWERADGAGKWLYSFRIPHRAWDGYAAIVLQSDQLTLDEVTALIQFFTQLDEWEAEVAIRADNPVDAQMDVNEGSEWREQFIALRQPLLHVRTILGSIAYAAPMLR